MDYVPEKDSAPHRYSHAVEPLNLIFLRRAKRHFSRIAILTTAAGQPYRLHKPTISCPTAFHGTGYGGWTLCPDGLSPKSVMYSFGVGEDTSFDLAVIEAYGVQVCAFDPTPRSITWVGARDWPPEFRFYPFGIAARDSSVTFYPPENPDHVSHTVLDRPATADRAIQVEMRRLQIIADMLGHNRIDVAKMDIEGAEYEVIEDITDTPGVQIGQILVEFHHFFPSVAVKRTYTAVDRLKARGYHIFHVSPSGKEYGFIKP